MTTIGLTGASGYIGVSLKKQLNADGHLVKCYGRGADDIAFDLMDLSSIESLDLSEVDVFVHLSGLAHDLRNRANSDYSRYDVANHQAAQLLAEKAKSAGVKQFIFMSTAKVLGANSADESLSVDSPYQTSSAYTASKMRAEIAVQDALGGSSDCAFTIIRPALVYDAQAKGNFARLLKLCDTPLSLPFGLATAKRQMTSKASLIEFISICINHPQARNQTFHVADKEALSTKEIVMALREGMNRPPRLIPFPSSAMKFATTTIKKPQWYEQLFQPFLLDISLSETLMNFDDKGGYSELVAVGKAYKGKQS